MPDVVDFARDELGVSLHPGQADALSGYYASDKAGWLLLAGRRSGKSLLADVTVCYEAVVPTFDGVLRRGEERYIIVVSVRQDNASLHIANIAALLGHTRALGKLVAEQGRDRLRLSNGVTIISLPASARAGRGFTASTLVFDELAHFVDSQGNASADAVYDAFSPTVATFGDWARVVITTTPAAQVGVVYDLYDRATSGKLPDWHVTRKATRELNPAVSEKTIAHAMARDAESATVEYGAEFAEPVQAFLSSERLTSAIDRPGAAAAPAPGEQYVMAVDPAVMADRYGFVIGHKEDGRVIVDYAHLLHPPVNPAAAEDLLLELVRRYRPYPVLTDSAALVQRLQGQVNGLQYTPFTRPMKLRIYGSLKEALNLGQLSLYPHADLIDELKALQIRNGVDIAAPRAGRVTHDDLADCLALVCDKLVGGAQQLPAGTSGIANAALSGMGRWRGGDDQQAGYERMQRQRTQRSSFVSRRWSRR